MKSGGMGPMEQLIKERKPIVRTITKIDNVTQTAKELSSYEVVAKSGALHPKVMCSDMRGLSIEYVEGLSAFRVLEILSENGDDDAVRGLLASINFDTKAIQASARNAISSRYPFEQKMIEVSKVLQLTGEAERSKKLHSISLQTARDLIRFSSTPFRDATPKNLIVKGVTEKEIHNNGLPDKYELVNIDFSTLHMSTHISDDPISSCFHYMINDNIRDSLLRELNIDLSEKSTRQTLILRLGRFWARRSYYFKYCPERYLSRYPRENFDFYTEQFFQELDVQ